MTTFGPPLDLAATYGPGKQAAVCGTCHVPVLLDDLEGHRDWHVGAALTVRDLAAARLALAAVRDAREKRAGEGES